MGLSTKERNPLDKRAKQMARTALSFAMENNIVMTYGAAHSFYFFFPRHGRCSDVFVYLEWDTREELFSDMMEEAKRLTKTN